MTPEAHSILQSQDDRCGIQGTNPISVHLETPFLCHIFAKGVASRKGKYTSFLGLLHRVSRLHRPCRAGFFHPFRCCPLDAVPLMSLPPIPRSPSCPHQISLLPPPIFSSHSRLSWSAPSFLRQQKLCIFWMPIFCDFVPDGVSQLLLDFLLSTQILVNSRRMTQEMT